MRIHHLPLALLLGLSVLIGRPGLAAEPAPEKKIDGRQIAKLVEQLGSGQFDDRERASQALDEIGLPALEALKKAAQNDDPEVRRRAEELVVKIEKRTQSARLLTAKRVHLVYKDTPLAEAVADFRKQSGYDLVLTNAEAKLKDRTITLDTGDVTFWQAMELFCQKAGLVAGVSDVVPQPKLPLNAKPAVGGPAPIPPLPIPANVPPQNPLQPKEQPKATVKPAEAPQAPPPAPPGQGARPAQQAAAQVAVQIVAQPGAPGALPGMAQPGQGSIQIVLKPGKQDPVPTDTATAVRVRALRPAGVAGPLVDGELRVILQATPEPRLRWGQLISVNVDKAVDDQNQSLTQLVDGNAGANVGFGGVGIGRMMPMGNPDQELTLRLKQGEKPAKLLKELTGTLSAQLLSAPQPLITADNILKAAGKTFKGAEGGFLKINEVTRDANGQVKVRFEMEAPPNAGNGNALGNGWGGAIQIVPARRAIVPLPPRANPAPLPGTLPVPQPEQVKPKGMLGAQVVQPAQPVQPGQPLRIQAQIAVAGPVFIGRGFGGLDGVTLLDDKGNTIPQVGMSTSMRLNGNVRQIEYVLTFKPQGGQEPEKLVYSSSKSFNVEIPFSLKDVPLQ